MIAFISGKIKYKSQAFLVVENAGIGYKIFVGAKILSKYQVDDSIEIHTYQNVKEDCLDLYGFLSLEALDLFEKLISVSGIGPKTALAVFAMADIKDIKSAIINGDSSILKKVSGIGAKTAERIVLELKNKLGGLVGVDLKSREELDLDNSALEALVSLGYSAGQAREALKSVPAEVSDVSDKVKAALQYLAT
jgi:Holliday junction DNA helicase RuvA